MTVTQDLNQHPRVSALLDCFREADVVMRELPLYNAEVAIEAIDFRAFGEDALIGVVLTPWFMNLVLLPVAPEPMRMAEIGRPVEVALPVGKRTFVIGGNDVVGLYRAHSLHSPVLTFTLPGQAQAEARRQLALLMTPPAQERAANQNGSAGVDRRRLLFGRGAQRHQADTDGTAHSARPPRRAASRPTAVIASTWSMPLQGCARPA
jgi:[NiFe] hydrogenase assembly HybE family chaperone